MLRNLSILLWAIVALLGGVLGAALISDEPGATAGRWYLGFAALAAILVAGFLLWSGRAPWALAVLAVLLACLIAAHAFLIVAFAYQGLTGLLLVPAVLAALLAVFGTIRNRRRSTGTVGGAG